MTGVNIGGPIRVGGDSGDSSSVLKTGDVPAQQTAENLIRDAWRAIPALAGSQAAPAKQVVLFLGQSNMQGSVGAVEYTPDRQGKDAARAGCLELSDGVTFNDAYRAAPAGEEMAARCPSQGAPATVVFDATLPCLKRLRDLNPDSVFVGVNRALDGSGFTASGGSEWNPGDAHYESIKTEVNAYMASNPEARITAIIWHQGESDAVAGMTGAAYRAALQAMVADIRANFTRAAEAVFVCGTMHPLFIEDSLNSTAEIDAEHRAIAANITDADVVLLDAFPEDEEPGARPRVHFDEPGLRYFGEAAAEQAHALMDARNQTRVPPVWMRYDEATGGFADAFGGGFRVFSPTLADDPRYGKVLSVGSGTGYNTDIPLHNGAYTKVLRVKFTSPTASFGGADYHLMSGATPDQEFEPGVTPDTTDLGTWWTTRTHTHQAARGTYTNTASGILIGALLEPDTWHTLALTYDSSLAVGSRFAEFFDGASAGTPVLTTSNADGNDGGQVPSGGSQIIQLGCYAETAMAATWAGQIAEVVTLPYAASADEIATIHEAMELRQRGAEPVVDLGVNPTRAWESLLTPGSYRMELNGGTPNLPSEKGLPWDAATYAGVATGPNVYHLRVEHAGASYGYVTARCFATSPDTSDVIMREWRCAVISNAAYTLDWTRTSEWEEVTNTFDDSDGSVRRITFAAGVPSYPQA